jgi:hypothetical protein
MIVDAHTNEHFYHWYARLGPYDHNPMEFLQIPDDLAGASGEERGRGELRIFKLPTP